MAASLQLLLSQMPPPPPAGWERIGIVTLLVLAIFVIGLAFFRPWVVVIKQYTDKVTECEEQRTRAVDAELKYVQLLQADIEERKSRDKTLELLSKAASRNNRNPFEEEG